MLVPRRAVLAASLALPALARAQDGYPARPLRLIVPFTPAGTTDISARLLAAALGPRVGQQVVVENRPGAGGNVGAEVVARAEPDGYTLLLCTISTAAINYSLYGPRMPFKPEELAAVGLMLRVPNLIFVTNGLPVRSLQELVAYAKAHPGELNQGSSGIGTSLHLTGELLKTAAGIDMTHVPFRGSGPMIQEVLSGRIQMAVDNLPSVIGHAKEGRVRPLAVTTKERSPALPDVPTTAEAGFPDVEATAWFGVQAPARTPEPIIARLGREIDAAVQQPELKAKIADLGGLPPGLTPEGGTTPAAFAAFIKAEIAKWSQVVKASGATAE
ncbi:MAG TPA: tripartite tricarboxylate transporter substrate binding protein [Crenalkalicoccus sp.]|nr:tripartite tricarboxylate transporter substrate binding protein [Crenalkalicoccus sp.]